MLTLHLILQQIYQFFHSIAVRSVKVTKQMYRSSAVFMAGATVITVVAFTSAGFGSGGKNALTVLAETNAEESVTDDDTEEESVTEAKIQVRLTEVQQQGQKVAGSLLVKDVWQRQEAKQNAKEEIDRINKQIAVEEEARKAEEEARRREEEARAARAMTVSDEDYQVLLKIVQAEAGICDDKGKILVANVILNRVRSDRFPDTVRGVVYAPSQFSPVSNGTINSVKVTDSTRECVDRALAGEDYSDGALYFMYRNGSRGSAVRWFDSNLTYLFQHGNHEFFK